MAEQGPNAFLTVMAGEDITDALAQAAMAAGGTLSDGGDLKVEVSVVGLLLALHRSVSTLTAELRAGLASKVDRPELEALALQVTAKASGIDVDNLGIKVRNLDTRTTALEVHKHTEEEKIAAHAEHSRRDEKRVMLVWKIAGAGWAAITTVLLILATAGILH